MEKITFLDLLLSGLFFLENFAKKIISVFTTITKKAGGLVVSDTFGWSNLLRLKKGTYQLVFCLALLSSATAFSQLAVPFTPRLPGGSVKVKGDIVLIGNSIITGKSVSLPYNGTTNNNNLEGEYINVASGGDPSIFSSSTADLNINNSCKSILYAGLYWASIYPLEVATNKNQQFVGTPRLNDWNQVKFKLPTGGFIDLVADNNPDPVGEEDDIIFDGYDPVNINNSFKDSPIICYKNVTSLLQGLADADGTYTLANLRATRGWRTGGCAAGWTLVVIYESPTMPSKFISTFDGYAGVQGSTSLEIPVAGFQTLPAPSPVIAKIGVSALEGDWGIKGDSYSFKASTSGSYTFISDGLNPWNNFFNSRLTNEGAWLNNRNPNGTNALGFDIKSVRIPNGGNSVLPNGSTAGDLKLTTSGDGYGAFVTSFAVDIIEPKILLTKIVEDKFGNEIGGANVTLGDELNYVIGFQNIGNDDATKLTIRDVLPINVLFNYPSDLDILPPGVSVKSYDPITREIVFEVEDWVVTEGDPSPEEIRFKVQVVPSCNMLSDACSNSIDNQAYATYEGVFNPNFTISDDPSINSNAGCILTPKATNFLVGVDDCLFTQTETLCGDSVVLTAANGYSSYSWSTDPSGSPVIGTTQSITVNNTGTYYVHNTAVAPCLSINQEITVIPFGNTITNPVAPFADEVVTCPNDGKLLPNIFLCGANAERVIQTGISDTSSIIWEKLDEGSCTAVVNTDCANESSTCTWTQVGTGPDFTANTSGQYRITLNYTGGCFNRYYFNVYQNLLNPTVTTKDIICTTPGEITVGGVPGGYEYSLDNITYQVSNVFPITSQNSYTVYIKQVGVTSNPCIFTVPDIQIRERNFTVSTVITQPYCNGDLGSVKIAANDVRPQYSYAIYSGGTLVNSAGPIVEKDYEFKNLNPGIYTIEVTTEDGCFYSGDIEIINPPLLTATASITKPLTCTDGEITINPVGGTPPYNYIINGGSIETDPVIVVTTPGVYNIIVYDANNCLATTSITIDDNPAPVYTISTTDILCYNDNSGDIQFNVTNANGYTLEYSIDNGVTYVSNPVFSNLSPGNYQAIIKYTLGASECFTIPENITLNQPDEALTASAGVSELAGCGPSGEGKVRITNPQGGTPPYEYSFDNQATWVSTNESYVLPGTYTLYIRDANGCIYAMPSITLDPEPVAPTINVSDPDFNCDGTAGATVTVTNPGSSSFNYNYLLDGVPNPNTADPKTFLDVSDGSHLITVEYILQSVTTYSNLLKEDFGSGSPTTSSGIASAYCFNDQRVNPPYNCGTRSVEDNQYSVASFFWRSDDPSANNTGAWYHFKDHTTNGVDPNGRYLLVNIGSAAGPYGILYSKPISDVIPNQDIKVELYLGNLIRAARSGAKPDFIIQLVDNTGAVIAEQNTGQIQNNEIWNLKSLSLNPGNNTDLTFVIRSGSILYNGNDAVIDDISVYQLPKSCVTKVDFPFIVDSGKAFASSTTGSTNVTCNGSADGTITIAAQNFDPASGFEYSIDNGITWTTQITSPYTITGLAAGNYDVMVRYETCSFTFSQTITAPAPLGVSVSGTPVTCLGGSTVTAIATGGTTAYSYQLLDTATSALVSNFPSNGILTNVPAGDYTVRVTDANGCTATDTINLVDSAPPTASIAMTSDYCYDPVNGATLEVTASGGVTPYEYSINGGSFGSSNIFSSLTPGSYDIIVRDAYGCTVALPTETIAPQVTVNTTLTKELDCSATPDATITGTITGGYAPFSYAVSTDGGVTYGSLVSTGSPFVYTAASSGNYQFQITDARGCQSVSNVITISPITNPVVTGIATNVSCNGASDGSVQLVGSGGSGGYTYSDDGITFTGTSLFTGLSASGSPYTFYVQDSKNCSSSVSITITEPTALVASATATDLSCSATNTNQSAEITIAVPTTGTAPYQYSFDGGANFSSANTLTVNDTGIDQTFSYVVRDANGCTTVPQNITIVALDPPTDLTFSSAAVTCIATTTDVTLTATDGVGPLEYETIAPSPTIVAKQASNVFTGLAPGTYVFRVTDANGCYYTESYTINPVTNITVSGALINDVSCNGSSNGAVDFTVSNFAGTYSYTINGNPAVTGQSAATINLTALPAGDQVIVVTDETTGCTDTVTVTVSEPAALTLTETTNINANCNAPAQVSVTAGGGTPGYTYAFVQNNVAPIASDYTASANAVLNPTTNTDWDAWVMDANGCTTKLDIAITSDPVPTIDSVPLQCFTGTPISITVTGTAFGVPTYSIGGAYQASPTFTINSAGTYNVSIKDGNGCIASTTYVVEPELLLDANMTQDLTCAVDASITLTPSGGTGTYTAYEVSYNGGGYVAASTPYTATVDGTYQFRVTDSQNCTAESNIITVTPKTTPTLTFTQTNATCNGDSDGSIVVTANSGIAPYEYSIDNGITFQASNVFNGLNAAGTYNVVVRDSKSCVSLATLVTITEPTALVASATATDLSCSATNTNQSAEITIAVPTTGTAPYQYSFDGGANFSSANTLTVNDTGIDQTFSYVVRDANGCTTVPQNITIVALDPPTDLTFSSAAVTCIATTTDVTLTATDGVGPLEYETIAPSPTIVAKQASNVFTGLAPGTYVFRVTDANGCYYTESYTINPVTNITVSGALINDVSCNGSSNGAVDFTVSNFAGTYSYTINGNPAVTGQSAATINLTALPAGDQVIVVTDETTGCTDTVTVTVSEPAALTLTETTNINANCNAPAQVSVTAGGGTPGYTYAFVQNNVAPIASDYTASANAVLNPTTNTDWDAWVMDANGCTTKLDIAITSDPVPTIDSVPLQCFTGTPISITVTGTAFGVPTYSIGGAYQASPTFTINSAGTYNVSIKDGNGCIASTTYVVEPELLLDANMTQDLTCAVDASITLTPSGGTGTYSTYEVSTDGGATYVVILSSTYTTNTSGTYQFRVTDDQGCQAESSSIIVNPAVPVTASFTSVDPTCNGYNDGSITLTASAGEAPFTYSIDNGVTFVSSNVFGGLVAGTYDYIVKDSKDCETIPVTITLNDPAPIVPTIGINGIACGPPFELGSFDIDIASGGTAPYTYKLYNNSFTEIDTYTTTLLPASFVHSFTGHDFGDYYITIVDAIGCEYKSSKLRIQPTPFMNVSGQVINASCATGVDVSLDVTGGVPDYTYSIYGDPTSNFGPTSSTTHTFTGLDQGTTYQFKVVDANGCPSYWEFTTGIISPIIINPLVATNVTCFGADNGEIAFTVNNYDSSTTDLYYEVRDNLTNTAIVPAKNGHLTGLTGAPAPGTITGLPAGNYTLYVKEFDGTTLCSTTEQFQITQPLQPLASAITAEVNANCNSGAQLTLTTTGGTGPYQYAAVRTGDPAPAPGDYGTSNVIIVDTNSGVDLDWVIYVKDANDCQTTINKTVIQDPLPTVTVPAVASNQCTVTSGFTFTAVGASGVPPYQYSINGGASYQSSDTFTVNTPGSYTVTIKDANGCTATSPTPTVVYAPLTSIATVTKELDCTVSPDAVITVDISGGNGPFTYTVQKGAGAVSAPTAIVGTTFTYSVAPGSEDTYTFEITDANGCTTTSIITVDPITNPVVTATKTDVSCNGASDGTVQLIGSGGSGGYTYSDDGTTFTATSLFTGLPGSVAGITYTFYVQDSKNCTSSVSVTITEPTALVATASVTTPLSCSPTNTKQSAEITIAIPSTGTAPYQYSFNGGTTFSSTNTLTVNDNGSDQIFSYVVKDANGCSTVPQNITVVALDPPTDLAFTPLSAVTCSDLTGGSVQLSATNGVGILSYAIVSPASATTNMTGASTGLFTGLSADTYMFEVIDANGCYYQESYTVDPVTNITISGLKLSDVLCKGDNTGAIQYTVSDFAGTYTPVLTSVSGAGTLVQSGNIITLTGLVADTYTLVVTDDITGCTASSIITIDEPTNALSITSVSATNVHCNEYNSQITVTATGGTPSYTYAAVVSGDPAPAAAAYNSSNIITVDTNLGADLAWDVYVRDANGCITLPSLVTITEDPLPTVTVPAVASNQCTVTSGFTFTAVGASGVPPYQYSINGGASYQSSDTFTVNTPGSYTVTIKDANGCTATSPTPTVVYAPLTSIATVTKELDCTVSPDAVITVDISGGNGPFTYTVQKGAGAVSAPTAIVGTTFTYSVAPGSEDTYTFEITDANGCTTTSIITVDPITNPVVTATKTDVSCNGASDGTVQLIGSGGSGGYTYSDDGTTFTATSLFTGLPGSVAGITYTFYVQDSKNCTSSVSVTITEPTALVATASVTTPLSCSPTNTKQSAEITIAIPSTGTAPYQYSFNGGTTFSSTNTLTVNDNGSDQIFSYVVKDANGCSTVPQNITVVALDPPTDLAFTPLSAVTCSDLTGGSVQLSATNGVGILSYAIVSPASATTNMTGASTGLFTGLSADTYMFEVIDANGCYYQESYTVDPVTNITISGLKLSDVLCKGDNTGAIQYTVSDFAGTYTPVLTSVSGAGTLVQSGNIITLTGLVADTYTLVVTDDITGCTASSIITIDEPTNALSITSVSATNVHCNEYNSQITVTATGGTPSYTYAAVVSGDPAPAAAAYNSSNIITVDTNLGADLAWDVYVRDANGCITLPSLVTITEDPLPTVTVPAVASNQCNLTGDPYTFTVTSPTGVGPFTYSIGTGFQSNPTFTVSTPGTYNVTVKDVNGCTALMPTDVIIYPALDVTLAITTLPSCSEGDGVITVTGSGGSGNYSYSITPSASITQTGNAFSGLSSATNYTVTIEDTTTLCTKDVIVNLPTATPVTFTATSSDVSCNGGSDGGITVNLPASNDNPVYTYEITAGPTTVATQTSNSFSGLAAGTYTVLVTSGRGCTLSQDVTVNEPNPIVISAPIVVDYACSTGTNTTNFATITVNTVTGGSGTYANYEFIKNGTVVQFSNNNVYTESDLLGGTYTINVYDDNGCSGTTTATIAPYIQLDTINVTIDNAITCTNDEDITVSVSSIGGTPTNLEYTLEDFAAILPTQTNTTGIFTALPIGNYIITVTNLDTGCSLQKVHYISDPNTFDLTIDSVVDVTCFNDSDGSVNVTFIDRVPTPTDEAGIFDYTVTDALSNLVTSGTSTNAGPVSISGLASGTYTINATLTNAPYCSVSKNFTITAPTAALAIFETHTEITCVSGNNDGSISATATGGWPGGYEYQLELTSGTIITPFSNVSNFSGLTAGDYVVSVRDSRGCIASDVVTLAIPIPISATVTPSTNLLSCFGDTNASITVSGVAGGQGTNYTYTLNTILPNPSTSGPQLSPVFTGLGAGTYTVDITDGYNCAFTSANIVIAEPAQIQSLLVKSTSQTCLTGTTLTLSATGGTGTYEYSDTAAFTTVLGSFASSTTINVTPGTYMYYVRDANGCYASVSNQIKIDPLPPLVVSVDATNAFINCAGDNTGVIVATAQGGLGSYVYTLQDNLGNPIPGAVQNAPGVFTNLFAGNYQVQVDSGDCNTVSTVIAITEPASPLTESHTSFDVTCNGSDNGVLEINASGGTGVIKYAISPQLNQFFDTPTFDHLAPGTYDVIVQDELGCYIVFNFTINEPNPLMVNIVPGSLIPEVCTGDLSGEFSIDITGGTAPYSVALDDINAAYTTGNLAQTQFDFTGLAGGDHVVYVIDGQGCESEWNITFPESVIIDPEAVVEYGCVNNMSSNTVTVTIDASITNPSDVDYSLDGGPYQASNIFIDVAPGTHVIDARHTNGCIKSTAPFVIDQIDPLAMTIDDTQINQIVVTATGGSGIYEYALNGESNGSSNTFVIYQSGDYTVSVTDSDGCTTEITRYFEYIDICIPNYFTPNGDGVTDDWAPGCTITYKDLEYSIFDRYGRKIATKRLGQTWDGTYNGTPLPTGDYWYVIKLNDKNDDREFVGHFTLYR